MLFSATMPNEVVKLAQSLLFKPERIDVTPQQATVAKIDQRISYVEKSAKQGALTNLLNRSEVKKAIVFTRTKHGADRVARKLNSTNIVADAIHGNKSQNARTRALADFTSGRSWVLVATDIAARGIDISGVSHVINFELPPDPESYVHRIGRTGRAGASGVAWSLVDASERNALRAIERKIRHTPSEVVLEYTAEEVAANREAGERSAAGRLQQQAPAQRQNTPRRSNSSSLSERSEAGSAPSRRRRRNRRRKLPQGAKVA
jgi:ATP-dependent RNA helicase RhlE